MTQKQKYISKTVKFGGKNLTLYSLDGATWSSRKEELEVIKDRHEAQRVTAAQIRGEVPEGSVPAPASQQKPTAMPRFIPPKKNVPTPQQDKKEVAAPAKSKVIEKGKKVPVKAQQKKSKKSPKKKAA